jgi:hypothetical protein
MMSRAPALLISRVSRELISAVAAITKAVYIRDLNSIHKLGIVLKELTETLIWLRVIGGSELLSRGVADRDMSENKDLCRIFTHR